MRVEGGTAARVAPATWTWRVLLVAAAVAGLLLIAGPAEASEAPEAGVEASLEVTVGDGGDPEPAEAADEAVDEARGEVVDETPDEGSEAPGEGSEAPAGPTDQPVASVSTTNEAEAVAPPARDEEAATGGAPAGSPAGATVGHEADSLPAVSSAAVDDTVPQLAGPRPAGVIANATRSAASAGAASLASGVTSITGIALDPPAPSAAIREAADGLLDRASSVPGRAAVPTQPVDDRTSLEPAVHQAPPGAPGPTTGSGTARWTATAPTERLHPDDARRSPAGDDPARPRGPSPRAVVATPGPSDGPTLTVLAVVPEGTGPVPAQASRLSAHPPAPGLQDVGEPPVPPG